ncbi:type IV pilus assembly protein PilM [Schumannella luteola]|nr:type IV pilus assembly protein PilM [Schumannella luteola]TPX04503.1 type IV pilus assembly protein PilM [Schumannella luteola]
MASTIVGLDIGNGVIRAAELADPGKAKPTLLRYHSIVVPPTAIQKGEVLEVGTVSAALKQLWATAGFKSKKVVLGMGNQRVMVRDVSVPQMPLAQIKESLPFQVQELLPVPVADAILDFYPVSAGRSENSDVVNGLLIAAVKEPVLKNVEAVQAAGLDPVEVDLIPFALTRALVPMSDSRDLVAIVHIGATTTSVVIAANGVPQFVRIIQSGGEDITQALVRRLGLDAAQSDKVKRGFGLNSENVAPDWKPAVEAIVTAAGELIDSVRNTLSFFVNTHQGVRLDRAYLSGGGAQLAGLPAAMADAIRLPVGLPDPLARFSVAKTVDAERLRADLAGVPVAAGLALGSKS